MFLRFVPARKGAARGCTRRRPSNGIRIKAPLWGLTDEGDHIMIIGKFQNAENGRITGELDALLAGTIKLSFEPNNKGADYTVLTETGCEAGAGWKKTSKDGKAYVSVRLESPFLPIGLNAALFPAKEAGRHILAWDRPERKAD